MADTTWHKIRRVLNTEIKLNFSETLKGGVESAKAVLELAKELKEGADIPKLKPFIEKIDSVL
ncbi:MAG: hypothetical protein O4861_22410, partial [Trichodesmium sp. St16_bin4-tuft]|nr:hypothetical protein [Trichodesmium sp. St16_bin4-tuft]